STRTVYRRRKALEMSSVRQQRHTLESVHPHIVELRRSYPQAGIKRTRDWLSQKQIFVSEHLIREYYRRYLPEEILKRKGKRLKRKKFWTPGVFAVVAVDQHDKWQEYGLYLHIGMEVFSGAILWLKAWWTNKNPRLICSYYLESCRSHGGVPLLTQSDPGSENNGIANAQSTIRQHLDPSLVGTLQHQWMRGHTNVKPEIRWSQLRREFTAQYENLFAAGVINQWYDKHVCLENYIFRWLAIPFLQRNLDAYVRMYNTSKPRADKNKILPLGRPEHILHHPERFGDARNFKVIVTEADIKLAEELYAPPTHSVFQLTSPEFDVQIRRHYRALGEPEVTMDSFWGIYFQLRQHFLQSPASTELFRTLALDAEREATIEQEHMPLIEATEMNETMLNTFWSTVVSESERRNADVIREVEDHTGV
ncbi:hypothetical protein CALCODRAFT_433971, partial [Calocera cornea HHB12733]